MRAAVLVEPGLIEMQDRSVPSPASGEMLVQVSSVGVCGSDSHYYRHGRLGSFVVEGPLILGHEAAGTIVAVGDGVPESRIGQRVSIEPQHPDPDSAETRSGRYNLCPHMRFVATPPVDGALCDYVTIGAAFAHAAPDTISDDAAALCEPMSVGIAAVRKAGLTGGSSVLIAGAGPIGMTGVFRYANTWPSAIALVERGLVDLDAMVTGKFPLEKTADALDSDRIPGSVKAVVQVS